MKKFTAILLIFLSFTFNTRGVMVAFASTNIFTQGIYTLSDLNPSKKNIYIFSNISETEKVYFMILDENQVIVHAIRLLPKSEKHITVPILPSYKVIVLGEGKVYATPEEST